MIGRPPKPAGTTKRASLTFRLRPELRDRLTTEARGNSLSLSQQVERHLERPYSPAPWRPVEYPGYE